MNPCHPDSAPDSTTDDDSRAGERASPDELPIGLEFGSYVIEGCIGQGSMARVYRARHGVLNKAVALKVLLPELVAGAELRQRFLNEARAVAAIQHPNIVWVADAGIVNGVAYLAMELLEGENLAQRLEREGPLTVEQLVAIAPPLLDAVAAAHQAGVIHRDLKPANVFLARSHAGNIVPKLIDFGVSKFRDPLRSLEVEETARNLLVGSPSYFPPEVLHGSRTATERSDQYSFGVVLYECITGRVPFVERELVPLLSAICAGIVVAPRHLVPNIPEALERVILKAMSVDPAARFDHVRDLSRALGDVVCVAERESHRSGLVATGLIRLASSSVVASMPNSETDRAQPMAQPKLRELPRARATVLAVLGISALAIVAVSGALMARSKEIVPSGSEPIGVSATFAPAQKAFGNAQPLAPVPLMPEVSRLIAREEARSFATAAPAPVARARSGCSAVPRGLPDFARDSSRRTILNSPPSSFLLEPTLVRSLGLSASRRSVVRARARAMSLSKCQCCAMNHPSSIDLARLLMTSALLLHAPGARGQDPPSAPEQPPSSVDAVIAEGIRLRLSDDDAGALRAFQAAATLDGASARVRAHLAATHQALGEWLEADGYLRDLLAEKDDPYVQRHREALERAARFVDRRIGSLSVRGQPAGAKVRLSGRPLGALPETSTVRVAAGSHVLEVQMPGYYPARRPLTISGGDALRETVQLERIASGAEHTAAPPRVLPGAPALHGSGSSEGSPPWLSWTLTGLAGGAAIATGFALLERGNDARDWNSDDCLRPGLTRGDVCRDFLDAGKAAERFAYWSLGASLLLGAGAATSWLLSADDGPERAPAAASGSCSIGLAGASCSGRF